MDIGKFESVKDEAKKPSQAHNTHLFMNVKGFSEGARRISLPCQNATKTYDPDSFSDSDKAAMTSSDVVESTTAQTIRGIFSTHTVSSISENNFSTNSNSPVFNVFIKTNVTFNLRWRLQRVHLPII